MFVGYSSGLKGISMIFMGFWCFNGIIVVLSIFRGKPWKFPWLRYMVKLVVFRGIMVLIIGDNHQNR